MCRYVCLARSDYAEKNQRVDRWVIDRLDGLNLFRFELEHPQDLVER